MNDCKMHLVFLNFAQAAVKEYVGSDAHKKERRDIDKQLTKVTQQISGTRYVVSHVPYCVSEVLMLLCCGHNLLQILHDILSSTNRHLPNGCITHACNE